ncbi:MAG: TonB-dependent receptor, partial [Candidatus Eiseniibacteriota bacterium]
RGHAAFSYGSLSTRRYQGSLGATLGDWSLLGVATHFATHGNFRFLDDNGTPYNPSDDTMSERVNNALAEEELFVKLGRPLAGGTLVVADQLLRRRQGLPGHGSYQSLTEALARTYNLLHASWSGPCAGRLPLEVTAGLFVAHEVRRFEDRRAKRPPAKPDVENRTVSWGGTLRWWLPLPDDRQSLRGLVEFRDEGFRTRETFERTTDGPRQGRRSFVVTLEDEIRLAPDWLRLVPGGRYERLADRTAAVPDDAFLHLYVRSIADTTLARSRLTGSLGAIAEPGAGLTFKANYGRYHREPALIELFGYQGSVLPNPRLKPERGESYDLGLRWDAALPPGDVLSVEYAHFVSLVEDLIVWTRRGQASGAINFDRADLRGDELTLAAGHWHGLGVEANLTRLAATNTGPQRYAHGKSLPDRPELAVSARLGWRRGVVSLFYELDYLGGDYWNAYNGVAPNTDDPARVRRLHAAGGTVPTGLPELTVTLELKNLGNEQVEDVMGFPMPGRTAYATLDYRF